MCNGGLQCIRQTHNCVPPSARARHLSEERPGEGFIRGLRAVLPPLPRICHFTDFRP